MATITSRKRRGGMKYSAVIRIKRNGKVVHSETETFDKKSLAKDWAARRESELKRPGALEQMQHKDLTVGQVLEWYRDDFDGKSKFGRSKLSHIEFLIKHHSLSKLDAIQMKSSQLVAHISERRRLGAGASTVNNDIIWLRNAFRAMRIARNIPLDLQVIDDASFLCRKEKLIAKSTQRTRRPSLEELNNLMGCFDDRDVRASIPMAEVVLFALFSSRRQDEICRIRWTDLDEENQRVLVRDMKHPREKVDTWVFLTDAAWNVIQRQPKLHEKIFPYNGKSISAAFTKTCHLLEIDDLRFHDLRHECTSWLFELGWDIPRVSGVTGHKSWSSLQRYTHLRALGIKDKYKNWVWFPKG
ncbi:site-specific integrase [uncultured Pseudoteredinibacter sp.]|uniref:tyrosine-type recombinase/integrase n=1 Tax=uncultured Pseudoteredinibacter sp. TaxID=1641701 RepID=UPI002606B1D6|nr:site-specific integrase [uncultured Pseudoteredinibacter sp.]